MDFTDYKLPEKKNLAAYEWQDRCATIMKELNIPKQIKLGNKTINLHAIAFRLFKRNRSQAEAFYQAAKEKEKPGRYFAWLMLNRKKL